MNTQQNRTKGEAVAESSYIGSHFSSAARASEARPSRQDDFILGRYRIMEECGTGGFGTVLTCWDTRLQRRVAIKRMPLTEYAGVPGMASTLADGLAEARTSSMLAHPNIVTVYDFERDADCAYLVMEYVDGITLTELLRRVEGGTLTPDECSYLVDSLGSALSFAHENGVLHLDIKPSNIMIDHKGTVKLCDFGMATLASATGYGDARGGTVGYMPPEQIEGSLVDERSDVFSLAVVVWQSLTGENPFAAPTAERSLELIKKGPRTKISKVVPNASGMTEEALLGALDPNPSQRTPSIADFASEVTFALGDANAGAASIRHLVSQAGQREEDEEGHVAEQLPLFFRYPWIEGTIARLLSMGCVVWIALSVVPSILDGRKASLITAGIMAACAAAWPPLGSALALVLLSAALLTATSGAAPILTAGFLVCLSLAWWALAGIRNRHATPSILLPFVLGSPIAGASYAGAFLKPAHALVTSGFAWATAQVYLTARTEGFAANEVVHRLMDLALRPECWIQAAGCVFAAFITSAVTRFRPSAICSILGQLLGCCILVFSQLLAARVENDGIWVSPNWDTMGIAVVLCILTTVAVVICGPRFEEREDDYDELV